MNARSNKAASLVKALGGDVVALGDDRHIELALGEPILCRLHKLSADAAAAGGFFDGD